VLWFYRGEDLSDRFSRECLESKKLFMKSQTGITHFLTFSALILLPLLSCTDERIKELEKEEAAGIQSYLTSNPSLNFDLKKSGLYYLEVEAGTGLPVNQQDTAYVFYTSKLLDGTQVDSNSGTTDTLIFPVGRGYVISGFDEGVTYMKAGGKALFLVPSRLGFGSTGNYANTIPGFTPLLFNVQLVRVKPHQK
jgi:peptidyl-prolyl cis-trans isomerase A (cyclophilin A)